MALSRSKMVAIVATGFNYTISHQFEAPADITFPQQSMNLSRCAADPSAADVSRNARPSPSIVRSCSWLVVLAAWQAMHRLDDNASAVMLSAYSQPHGGSVGPSRNTSYERANSVIWGPKEEPNIDIAILGDIPCVCGWSMAIDHHLSLARRRPMSSYIVLSSLLLAANIEAISAGGCVL